jgi:hypothetical protein
MLRAILRSAQKFSDAPLNTSTRQCKIEIATIFASFGI